MTFEDQIKKLTEQKVAIAKQLAELTISVTHPPDKEAKKKLAELKQSLNFVVSAHKALVAAIDTSPDEASSSTPLPAAIESSFEQKPINLPNNLPEFRTGGTNSTGNPELFIERLQLRLRAAKIAETDRRNILPICPSDLIAAWLELNVPTHSSWIETKEMFLKH